MSNIERYNHNLIVRRDQLRKGDPAYEQHFLAIVEMIVHAGDLHETETSQRIADIGCGLGFLTAKLTTYGFQAVGIDPSREAISLARQEHPYVRFFPETAAEFANRMHLRGLEPFDQAILNMVLHSVDDETVLEILMGIKSLLIPGGTIQLLVPSRKWLIQKLIENAQDNNMNREDGITWIEEQLKKEKIELIIKIGNGKPWPSPITIYNRTLKNYGELLQQCGFGVVQTHFRTKDSKFLGRQILPYWELDDYTTNLSLIAKFRHLLMSFALIDER